MTKKYSTKRSLIASILVLCLCFTSFVGTTFAWFTDSVTSANNIIKSGNLDIVLEYYDTDENKWKDVQDSSDILTGDLWEPGYVDVAYFRIKNAGSLALRYQFGVNIVSEKVGKNVSGGNLRLSDYIYFDVEDGVNGEDGAYATREDAMKIATEKTLISAGYSKPGTLEANSSYAYFAMVVYMPTSVGNEANHNGENVPEIDLGINVLATQYTYEKDSFDEQYDKDAAVTTVEAANALMASGKDAYLIGADEVNSVIEIPAGYKGTLTLGNVNVKSIQAAGDANIVISGNVVVNAYGDGTATVSEENGTSAITANGALKITGNGGTLTAIANGGRAYGIGGEATTEIVIKNLHIVDVKGGYVQPEFINDTNYGKNELEGGAAIGSGSCGAVITLDNVTVDNAEGGSKAAGIGARFWTGVTINIKDSVIANVEGGNASAGIGGSRVSKDRPAAEQHVKINIENSIINAIGGQFGAGIGSGYDTNCGGSNITATICTINIDAESNITAKGGKYAAGVGTGYHVAALAGNIECKVNAVSGGNREKYTVAQAVGFGVVDHTREVSILTTAPSITYQGTVIGVPGAQVAADKIGDAISGAASGDTVVFGSGNYTLPTLKEKEGITLEGLADGSTVIGGENASTGFSSNFGKNTTIKNITFSGSSNGVRWSYANGGTTVFDNCTFAGDSTYGFHIDQSNGAIFIFNNCTFSGFNAFAGDLEEVVFNNCTFLHNGSYGHTNIWSVGEFNNCTFGEGATYGIRGDGRIYVNGALRVTDNDELTAAVLNGETKIALTNGDYDLNGNQRDGLSIVGLGDKVNVANTTKYASGKSIGAIWQAIHLENVTITNTVYTMADGGNSTFKNVNFAAGFRQGYGKNVVFEGCSFGSNSEGYAFHFQTDSASEGGNIIITDCEFEGGKVHLGGKRAYTFTGCEFAEGTDFQIWSTVTLDGCTVGGVEVTAENANTLFPNLDLNKVTFK